MDIIKECHTINLAECFSKLAEQSQDVFWIRSVDQKHFFYVSPAYESVWGRTVSSLSANPQNWLNTIIPDDRVLYQKQMFDTKHPMPGDVFQCVYRIIRPDNTVKWIKDNAFPLFDVHQQCYGVVGISEDVTKDILHQRELQEAKQHAETANHVKMDFLAMMSHELRTPLNTILGIAHILRKKEYGKEIQEYVNIISHAGRNLLTLVSDILDFAKLEVGKLEFVSEPIDLRDLVAQVVYSIYSQAAEKNLDLSFTYPAHMPSLVLGDSKRIRQVLINLVSNAIKFTEQGFVRMDVECVNEAQAYYVFRITVSDSGIGISSEHLHSIFEKFNQVDSVYQRKQQQGTGLGLAISRELVERMDGAIFVQSEVGEGSQFIVELPLMKQVNTVSSSQLKVSEKEMTSVSTYDLRILLVEDNSINQRIAKIILEEAGCHVDIAGSGNQVLALKEKLRQFDLIFMDIGLPDINGFDVVSEIRSHHWIESTVPIIAMTAHLLERDKQLCFAVGMNGILEKPIQQDDLNATLHHWYSKKQARLNSAIYS